MLVLFVSRVLPTPVELNEGCDGVLLRSSGVGALSLILSPVTAVRDAVVEGI